MDTSSTVTVPTRNSARPIQPLSSSLMDKFLGMSLSPASVQSLSSDTSDANDLDELDEQEIWGIEIDKPQNDTGKGQAALPPRMTSTSRRLSSNPEGRSPLNDGIGTSWISSTINSLSSISGTIHASSPSPLGGSGGSRSPAARVLSSEANARRVPSASRMIPRMSQPLGEGSSSSGGSSRTVMMPQSAPLNIPRCSRFDERNQQNESRVSQYDGGVGEDDEQLPPHILLAREYAKSEKTSFSVLEGAGRTLKGRDLSRVRNAVLTYTGFVE